MSNVAHNLSPAEIEERRLFLARLAADFPKRGGDVVPLRRAPLGLRLPADEPRDEVDDVVEDIASPPLTRTDDRAATLLDIDYLIRHALRHERKFVFEVIGEVLGSVTAEIEGRLRREIEGKVGGGVELRGEIEALKAEHRTELAELRLALTEARCEVREMRAIQESARIASRGEAGPVGARGIPGPPGPSGPAGARGEPGAKAAGFILNIPEYSATLVSSDGAPAARLAMRPLFEAFAEEIAAGDEG